MAKSRWNCTYIDDSVSMFGSPKPNGKVPTVWGSVESSVYTRWLHMMNRCYDKKDKDYKYYGEKGIYVEEYLRKFSNYWYFVNSLSEFDKLVDDIKGNTSIKYEIDKDKEHRVYNRGSITIITKEDNIRERNVRCGHPMHNGGSETQGSPCYCIDTFGNRLESYGYRPLSVEVCGNPSLCPLIAKCCEEIPRGRGNYVGHSIKRGKYLGWEFWKVGEGPRPYS